MREEMKEGTGVFDRINMINGIGGTASLLR
jgi:hypothetical protein